MNQYELESFELNFNLYDYNVILKNELIGTYSVGLSTVYRHANHEFFKVWLRLIDPNSPNPTECQGYLKVSCFIVGQNERPPVHANDDQYDDGEDPE